MEKKDVLLKIARAVIAKELGVEYSVDIQQLREQNRWLDDKGAVFVTLHRKGDHSLRGCIGSIIAHRSLYEDLIHNAKSSAFSDPRFPPLSKDEFDDIEIEVSLLSKPQKVNYTSIDDLKKQIHIHQDGVILKLGNYQATFLPQVWQELPSFELFFSHLCQKAGLSGDCLMYKPEIYTYQVVEYHE